MAAAADDDDDDAMDEDAGGIDVDTDGALTTHSRSSSSSSIVQHYTQLAAYDVSKYATAKLHRPLYGELQQRPSLRDLTFNHYLHTQLPPTLFGGGALFTVLTVVCPFIRLSVNSILKTSPMGEFS